MDPNPSCRRERRPEGPPGLPPEGGTLTRIPARPSATVTAPGERARAPRHLLDIQPTACRIAELPRTHDSRPESRLQPEVCAQASAGRSRMRVRHAFSKPFKIPPESRKRPSGAAGFVWVSMNGPKGASGSQKRLEKCPKALAAFSPRLAFGRGTGAWASRPRQRGFARPRRAIP